MTDFSSPPVAMILAAGKGTRMRPLTDHCPKPLLPVLGKPLIEWHLHKLKAAGVVEVVINVSYLGHQIESYIESRASDGLSITVINEGSEPFETAGGVVNALQHLGSAPFLLINGDVWLDLDYRCLVERTTRLSGDGHLVLVDNPEHNPDGDFGISDAGWLCLKGNDRVSYTFSGASVLRPCLFEGLTTDSGGLGPFLKRWAEDQRLSASVFDGFWLDVGTPDRLNTLEARLKNPSSPVMGIEH